MQICYNCFKEINNTEICPHCGYNPAVNRKDYPLALPNGTVLAGKYILGRVLGQGGFGITYLACDYNTKEIVAIKEYFPDTVAIRSNSLNVDSYSGQRQENFNYGKECFLNEAKTLAEFIGNPNIVRVHSYFEEYNTAYFAMEYVRGISFQTYIKNNGGKIGYEAAKTILFPIMDALSAVHSKGIIHRDISPDNIFITSSGEIKLLDFGAARYSMGDRSRSLDVVLKHGFAPKEQYTRRGRQGPYTDVYSLAATFYRAISGRIPPDSIDRLDDDELILPSVLGSDIPARAEDALLKGLAVQPIDRFQSVYEFKMALAASSTDYVQTNNTYVNNGFPQSMNPPQMTNGFPHSVTPSQTPNGFPHSVTPSQTPNSFPQSVTPAQVTGDVYMNTPPVQQPEPSRNEPKGTDKRIEFGTTPAQPDNNSAQIASQANKQEPVADIKPEKPAKKKKEKVKKPKKEKPVEPKIQKEEPVKEQVKADSVSEENSTKAKEQKPAPEIKQVKPPVEKKKKEKKKAEPSPEKKKDTAPKPQQEKTPKVEKASAPISDSKKKIIIAVASLCAVLLLAIVIIGVVVSAGKGDGGHSSSGWTYSIADDSVTIEKYTGNDADVEIPSEIEGAPVTAIGNSAFYECDTLHSVTIPDSVKTIGEWAFYGCDELTSVNLPDVATIKSYAFLSCEKLNEIIIPEGCVLEDNVFSEDD